MTEEQLRKYYEPVIELTVQKTKESFEAQLKEKDDEIVKYNNISAELFKSRTKCFEHIEQLEAVIEKQGERIRYLEQQFRDLNPKEVNG